MVATHDIFRYHGYHFLNSPPLRGNIKFFFPAPVNILGDNICHVNNYFGGVKLHKNCRVHSPMKPPNVTWSRQSDLKYAKNDLKLGKNDRKYYDLKWDFPLGGLYI